MANLVIQYGKISNTINYIYKERLKIVFWDQKIEENRYTSIIHIEVHEARKARLLVTSWTLGGALKIALGALFKIKYRPTKYQPT